MGVGNLRVWDKDIARKRESPQDGWHYSGICRQAEGRGPQSIRRVGGDRRTVPDGNVRRLGHDRRGLRRLKDCDIVFCCVDKFAPRVPLNDLAYAHLIPVLDMASWMHPDKNKKIDALMTHAHVWSPGIPCAWCRETLTSYGLTKEAQGRQQGIEKRIPYGLPLEDTDGVEPSVLPLNMLGVSLALMEFMQVGLKITDRTPNDLKFILPEWELDESDRPRARRLRLHLVFGHGRYASYQAGASKLTNRSAGARES